MTGRGGSAASASAKSGANLVGGRLAGLELAAGPGLGARVRGVQHDLAPALLDDDRPHPPVAAREEHDEVGARRRRGRRPAPRGRRRRRSGTRRRQHARQDEAGRGGAARRYGEPSLARTTNSVPRTPRIAAGRLDAHRIGRLLRDAAGDDRERALGERRLQRARLVRLVDEALDREDAVRPRRQQRVVGQRDAHGPVRPRHERVRLAHARADQGQLAPPLSLDVDRALHRLDPADVLGDRPRRPPAPPTPSRGRRSPAARSRASPQLPSASRWSSSGALWPMPQVSPCPSGPAPSPDPVGP